MAGKNDRMRHRSIIMFKLLALNIGPQMKKIEYKRAFTLMRNGLALEITYE